MQTFSQEKIDCDQQLHSYLLSQRTEVNKQLLTISVISAARYCCHIKQGTYTCMVPALPAIDSPLLWLDYFLLTNDLINQITSESSTHISTSVRLDCLHNRRTAITETSRKVKHGHISENYSLQEDRRPETEDNWFTTAFFPYPTASSKKKFLCHFREIYKFTHFAKNEAKPTG